MSHASTSPLSTSSLSVYLEGSAMELSDSLLKAPALSTTQSLSTSTLHQSHSSLPPTTSAQEPTLSTPTPLNADLSVGDHNIRVSISGLLSYVLNDENSTFNTTGFLSNPATAPPSSSRAPAAPNRHSGGGTSLLRQVLRRQTNLNNPANIHDSSTPAALGAINKGDGRGAMKAEGVGQIVLESTVHGHASELRRSRRRCHGKLLPDPISTSLPPPPKRTKTVGKRMPLIKKLLDRENEKKERHLRRRQKRAEREQRRARSFKGLVRRLQATLRRFAAFEPRKDFPPTSSTAAVAVAGEGNDGGSFILELEPSVSSGLTPRLDDKDHYELDASEKEFGNAGPTVVVVVEDFRNEVKRAIREIRSAKKNPTTEGTSVIQLDAESQSTQQADASSSTLAEAASSLPAKKIRIHEWGKKTPLPASATSTRRHSTRLSTIAGKATTTSTPFKMDRRVECGMEEEVEEGEPPVRSIRRCSMEPRFLALHKLAVHHLFTGSEHVEVLRDTLRGWRPDRLAKLRFKCEPCSLLFPTIEEWIAHKRSGVHCEERTRRRGKRGYYTPTEMADFQEEVRRIIAGDTGPSSTGNGTERIVGHRRYRGLQSGKRRSEAGGSSDGAQATLRSAPSPLGALHLDKSSSSSRNSQSPCNIS